MGYDPMTHRPRTDIFNSLPHLIALAKLKELVEHHHSSWDQGQQASIAMKSLQSEVTTLQYLNFLLQPQNMLANNMTTITNIQEMEAYNSLLNSMKDDQIIIGNNSFNNINIPPPNSTSLQDSIPFSHLPELQDMINTPTTTTTTTSPWQLPSSSSPPAIVATNDQSNSSINNIGGDIINCTPPFFGGVNPNSGWPDILLEDSFFHHIP